MFTMRARRKTAISKSTQMPVRLAALLILMLEFFTLGSTGAALLPPDDLAYSPKFFERLSEAQQDIGEAQQNTPHQSTVNDHQHLMKLISMKDSLSDLLTPNQEETLTDRDVDGADTQLDSHNDGDSNAGGYRDIQPPANKRVFCNGFTGCGGRYRAQRRRQGQHGADKRIFCNSKGCNNGGRKRGSFGGQDNTSGSRSKEEGFDVELWKQALKRLEELHLGKLRGVSKRLFCNYGGCRNVGKRRHLGAGNHRLATNTADTEGEIVAHRLLPRLDFVSSRQEHSSGKRFFASNVDGDLDSLIASLR